MKKIWTDVVLPCEAILLTLELLLLLGWALKMGKLYAMRKYVERFRRKDEETAAAAAMRLSNINTSQEEGVLQQEARKRKEVPGRNELQEVAVEKLVSRLLLIKRKIYLVLIMSLYDVALMIPTCIYLPSLKSNV